MTDAGTGVADPIDSQDREVLQGEVDRLDGENRALGAEIAARQAELAELKRERPQLVASRKRRRGLLRGVIFTGGLVALLVAGGSALHVFRGFDAVRIQGVARAVEGPIPVTVGEPCTVQVVPEIGPFNASLTVQCGDLRLYGGAGSGYGQCEVLGDRATKCHDSGDISTDGDPAIDFDRSEERVTVSDGAWSVEIGWSGSDRAAPPSGSGDDDGAELGTRE